MRNRKILILLTSVLTVIALFFLVLYERSEQQKVKKENVLGTYCTNASLPGGYYYVLEPDGDYIKYQQFQVLERGTYITDVNETAKIITLSESTSEKELLHENGRLYEFTQDKTIAVYEKISEISVFVNLRSFQNP